MRSRRTATWALAATGLLAAISLLPAGSAMASSAVPQAAPAGGQVYYVCANGGAGLCLQNNGSNGSLIANDNKIPGSSNHISQQWKFRELGVTSSTAPLAPFGKHDLDGQVASGRLYGQWESAHASFDSCLASENGSIELVNCITGSSATPGTEWVLSGSGRLINVMDSDRDNKLDFLNSDGSNGGVPFTAFGIGTSNNCPAACWGPNAG
jgi:hypothetical protein